MSTNSISPSALNALLSQITQQASQTVATTANQTQQATTTSPIPSNTPTDSSSTTSQAPSSASTTTASTPAASPSQTDLLSLLTGNTAQPSSQTLDINSLLGPNPGLNQAISQGSLPSQLGLPFSFSNLAPANPSPLGYAPPSQDLNSLPFQSAPSPIGLIMGVVSMMENILQMTGALIQMLIRR